LPQTLGKREPICIGKTWNPCGFAHQRYPIESYREALKCDPISAFGGVVAVNGVVNRELAEEMNKII